MNPRRHLADARPRDERGMVSVWVSAALVAFIVCVGLGVDFAGHAAAEQQARAVAAEAARAGGQFLIIEPGTRPRPDVHMAVQAANHYTAASSYRAATTVEGNTIHVQVTGTYQTEFLGIIGIGTLPIRVDGAATITPVIQGTES